ncbi:MAG TPA: hypothetical protein VFD72_01780 [Sphingobacteriaceae bacterium]|nr:hypothetical protein [Sphingobacteriaceae bacterium]
MSKLRITPLSMVLAGLLTWILWEFWEGEFRWGQMLYVLLLFIILVGADQAARVIVRDMRRIWIMELVFLIAVAIVAWIVKLWLVD